MDAKATIQRITLASLSLAAVAGAAIATAPGSAHADSSSRPTGPLVLSDANTYEGARTPLKLYLSPSDPANGTNIGVGELQDCTISKSMDMASTKLAQFAINGNSPSEGGNVEFEWKVEEGES